MKSFHTPNLNTLGLFIFELCSGQTNKQTNRLKLLPTLTDRVSEGDNDSVTNVSDTQRLLVDGKL